MARVDGAAPAPKSPAEPTAPAAAAAPAQASDVETVTAPPANDFEAKRQAALNRVTKPEQGEDSDALGVDVNKVPDTPPEGGVRQILSTIQASEGALGDIEMFDLPGERKIPKPREQWTNPMDHYVVVAFHPAFRVKPHGTFSVEKVYHDAMHDIAPQLRCPLGETCTKVLAQAKVNEAIEEERVNRKLARALLKE